MKKLKICLTLFLIVTSLFAILYYHFFVSMSTLPEGELLDTYYSNETESYINIYRCSYGATVDDAIRGEVVFETGKKKTIYWAYHENSADVKWIDYQTVSINGHILNIFHDKYDWRKNV